MRDKSQIGRPAEGSEPRHLPHQADAGGIAVSTFTVAAGGGIPTSSPGCPPEVEAVRWQEYNPDPASKLGLAWYNCAGATTISPESSISPSPVFGGSRSVKRHLNRKRQQGRRSRTEHNPQAMPYLVSRIDSLTKG